MKKKILVDARMVHGTGHGIAQYVLQMAKGLAEKSLPYEISYLISNDLPKNSLLRELPHRESKISFLHPTEFFRLGSEIHECSPDLFHSPSFSSLYRYPCEYVQTVHDLNHIHFGSLAQKLYYRYLLLPSMIAAKKLITVSKSSQAEISAWLQSHGTEKEIFVVPNAILPFSQKDREGLQKFGLEEKKYFLSVANAKAFKNLSLLKDAYIVAKKSQPNLPPLVLTIPGNSEKGIIYTGAVSEHELGTLFHHARLFFFPSLYEGFGRPPLESVLSGVVPVVSKIPPHEEALSGVKDAIFLNPRDEGAWIQQLLHWENTAGKISNESQNWAKEEYSIKKLADRMDAIYQSAIF